MWDGKKAKARGTIQRSVSGPEEKKALAVRNWEQAIDGKDASRVLALHMVRKDAQSISSYFFCAAVYNIVQ